METLRENGKMIGALLAGALVGAAIGVLFAPNSGSKTRKKISGSAKDWIESARKKVKNEASWLGKKADELESKAKNKVDEVSNNAKHKADAIK